MVAGSNHVDALIQQFPGRAGSEAETAGGIFPVGYDKVYFILLAQITEVLVDNQPPRLADNVPDNQYVHKKLGDVPL